MDFRGRLEHAPSGLFYQEGTKGCRAVPAGFVDSGNAFIDKFLGVLIRCADGPDD